jgi:hypothetical protein
MTGQPSTAETLSVSSLLQFSGDVGRRGVRLEFVLRPEGTPWNGVGPDSVFCEECGRDHDRIFVAWRKPRGTFGPWVIFRYNGADNVPDLSTPIDTVRLPRDARPLSDAETIERWHS